MALITTSPTSPSTSASTSTTSIASSATAASSVVVVVVPMLVVVPVLAVVLVVPFALLVVIMVIVLVATLGLPHVVPYVVVESMSFSLLSLVLDVRADLGALSEGRAWSDVDVHIVWGWLGIRTDQSSVCERVGGLLRKPGVHCCGIITGWVSGMMCWGN